MGRAIAEGELLLLADDDVRVPEQNELDEANSKHTLSL